jgi:hypothetical protein
VRDGGLALPAFVLCLRRLPFKKDCFLILLLFLRSVSVSFAFILSLRSSCCAFPRSLARLLFAPRLGGPRHLGLRLPARLGRARRLERVPRPRGQTSLHRPALLRAAAAGRGGGFRGLGCCCCPRCRRQLSPRGSGERCGVDGVHVRGRAAVAGGQGVRRGVLGRRRAVLQGFARVSAPRRAPRSPARPDPGSGPATRKPPGQRQWERP